MIISLAQRLYKHDWAVQIKIMALNTAVVAVAAVQLEFTSGVDFLVHLRLLSMICGSDIDLERKKEHTFPLDRSNFLSSDDEV